MAPRARKQGRGRKWLGGYVHHEADGTPVFVIERQVDGQRFHVSTRCNDEESALEHLARFQANPLGYSPAGVAPEQPLLLTNDLVLEHREWQLETKGNTPKHANSAARFLADWMERLAGRDLRKLTLKDDLRPALATWATSRQHRIIAIKAFFAWLRREKGLVRHAEDATLDLSVPQAQPEKHVRRKAVAWSTVRDTFAHLSEHHRDILQLAIATGWHVSELRRWCLDTRSTIERPGVETLTKDGRPVLAVLVVWHKTKKWTRTSLVHQAHVDAARRLRERGEWVNETRLREALAVALEAADKKRRELDPNHQNREPFTLGVMRHSVATWSVELGDRIEDTAAALDHADKRTTERFYADLVVPRVALTTRVLAVESPNKDAVN